MTIETFFEDTMLMFFDEAENVVYLIITDYPEEPKLVAIPIDLLKEFFYTNQI